MHIRVPAAPLNGRSTRPALQRYTRQLDEQENTLDALKQDVTRTSQQLANLRGELAAVIANVSFELPVSPRAPR